MADLQTEIPKASRRDIDTAPVGPLGIVSVLGTEKLAQKVDAHLVRWRAERETRHKDDILFAGYKKDSYLTNNSEVRFGTGEGKGVLKDSVRGRDLYFIVDVTNSTSTYRVGNQQNHYSPDDHYQDLKRLIAAAAGSAKRMTVVMPFLYEGRRDRRQHRESLDCALMLQELVDMGVSDIITFDAHEPRVQNAIPLSDFETVPPTYQYIKALTKNYDDLEFDPAHMLVVSPDESGMSRAVYFANSLGLDVGMFYRRKDYTELGEDGMPVVKETKFLGASVEGKDVIILDDMISSGTSLREVAKEMKNQGAARVFCCATFGLFTGGVEGFARDYEQGIISRVFTTNLIEQREEVLQAEWHVSVDMSKYIALLIDSLNHDESISELINPIERINIRVANYRAGRGE